MYGALLMDIVYYIIDGKHPNLILKENGLLYSNGREKAVTWMNGQESAVLLLQANR